MRHVLAPEVLPGGMKHYIALDYGLDRLCALYIAVDENERAVVYKEVCESGLIVSEAAEAVKKGMLWEAEQIFAPPDLWNRNRDTGKSTAELFADRGLYLTKVSNDRVQGWLNLKEWLRGDGEEPRLMIFDTCGELIRCLSEIGVSPKDPNDAATEPHHLTHAVDAMRYFVAGRPTGKNEEERPDSRLQRFLRYGA